MTAKPQPSILRQPRPQAHALRPAFMLIAALLAGCAAPRPVAEAPTTMLLVRLQDGSFVRQDIAGDADVCMKLNDDSRTMCLRRGEPIMDEAQRVVVGYRMQRTEIQLVPK